MVRRKRSFGWSRNSCNDRHRQMMWAPLLMPTSCYQQSLLLVSPDVARLAVKWMRSCHSVSRCGLRHKMIPLHLLHIINSWMLTMFVQSFEINKWSWLLHISGKFSAVEGGTQHLPTFIREKGVHLSMYWRYRWIMSGSWRAAGEDPI